eukprot:1192427-Prorocentrum_minimum.AAC.2
MARPSRSTEWYATTCTRPQPSVSALGSRRGETSCASQPSSRTLPSGDRTEDLPTLHISALGSRRVETSYASQPSSRTLPSGDRTEDLPTLHISALGSRRVETSCASQPSSRNVGISNMLPTERPRMQGLVRSETNRQYSFSVPIILDSRFSE